VVADKLLAKKLVAETPAACRPPAALAGCLLAVSIGLSLAARTASAQPAAVAAAQQVADDAIVATVDGEPIRYLDVKRQIVTALGGRAIPAEALPTVQAHGLEQVIYRRLIAASFRQQGLKLTPAEEAAAEQDFTSELARLKLSRDEYLRRNRLTEAELADFRYWDVNWRKFVAKELTDERLQSYYEANRREYDGTEVRVSHILLRLQGRGNQANAAAAVAKAQGIRQAILTGNTTFADAARTYSDGPSREQAGDLGFIPRRERMVEDFSAAAFRLKKGEISPPVVTTFGVHLITVTDEKPGQLTLKDVREAITPAVTAELFREVGRKLRGQAKIDYSGAIAHFDAAGEKLVPAGAK
jgi:peptidyl-prolyl cis-trans isomerase C